jgi:hypothetical protein
LIVKLVKFEVNFQSSGGLCFGRHISVTQTLRPSTGLAAEAGDSLGRVDNRDAGMPAEGEQIGITGDDQIRLRCGRES